MRDAIVYCLVFPIKYASFPVCVLSIPYRLSVRNRNVTGCRGKRKLYENCKLHMLMQYTKSFYSNSLAFDR